MLVRYKSALTGEHDYDIPDIWIAGFTTNRPGPDCIMEAVSWWAYQEYLKAQEGEGEK